MNDLLARDRRYVWHPYTQHATEADPLVITRAEKASLFDAEGKEILDLISSWWTCTHGHAHPKLKEALARQAEAFEHVMFAGFTHAPAIDLATALARALPGDLNRVFFSDDGSTAVEVALKAAFQYWANRGEHRRCRFFALEGGYHGDTLGAMALGKGSGYFRMFDGLLCTVDTLPYPATFEGDDQIEEREKSALDALDALLASHGADSAALIVEPLLQGAGGMRVCRPEFVKALVDRAKDAGLLIIFDEVATGFGRTGTLFAMEQVGVTPDFVCLSKGLTAGYMPMSVTVARDAIFASFLGPSFEKALAHGHSFCANPLACAVALASLALFEAERTLERIEAIGARHRAMLPILMKDRRVARPRVVGSVLIFDLAAGDATYGSSDSVKLRDWYLQHGLNIRPLGSTVYLMPPYCITDAELDRAYDGMVEGIDVLAPPGARSASAPPA